MQALENPVDVTRVGVVGAGVMGSGVAQDLARAYEVILIDTSEEILRQARTRIAEGLRLERMFAKAPGPPPPGDALDRITFSTAMGDLAAVQYVIENVTEKWQVKRPVYAAMDAICDPECVFAANTSAIPIAKIASATARPPRVIGIHFMNPAPMTDFVEVIPSESTSRETFDTTAALLRALGKDFIRVGDSAGFVSNRVLMLAINEAVRVVQEGISPAEGVDTVFRRCLNHRMGPLETADLIGLDTVLLTLDVLGEHFGQEKFRPCRLLRQMVASGLLGRKSGRGFYTYPGRGDAPR